jgi:hypothetical protein
LALDVSGTGLEGVHKLSINAHSGSGGVLLNVHDCLAFRLSA